MNKVLNMQFEFIRRSGLTNMTDRRSVATLADKYGFYELTKATAGHLSYALVLIGYERPSDDEYNKWLKTLTEEA